MQNFSKIVWVGFEIVFLRGSPRTLVFQVWGAGSGSLPTRPEEVGRCPDHLAEDCGCRWNGFVIRRRRACLGMPTDGGRWYECVELTKTVSC